METSQNEITIDVRINAPIGDVWNAWTDPEIILHWFGSDPNGTGLRSRLDVRPGGSFEITFKDADKTEHTCSGVYVEVEQLSKLSFTWEWKSEPGVETFVAVRLTPEKGQTRMLFQHSNLVTASRHDYLNGWQSTFLKLERMLTRKLDPPG